MSTPTNARNALIFFVLLSTAFLACDDSSSPTGDAGTGGNSLDGADDAGRGPLHCTSFAPDPLFAAASSIYAPNGGTVELRDVWASSSSDRYATVYVSDQVSLPTYMLMHFDGVAWSRVVPPPVGSMDSVVAIGGRSAGDVWFGGDNGSRAAALWHLANGTTTIEPVGFTSTDVSVLRLWSGNSNVFAAVSGSCEQPCSSYTRIWGKIGQWREMKLPTDLITAYVSKLWGTSDDNVYAVGSRSIPIEGGAMTKGFFWRFNGAWEEVPLPYDDITSLRSVSGVGSDVVLVGQTVSGGVRLYSEDLLQWTRQDVPGGETVAWMARPGVGIVGGTGERDVTRIAMFEGGTFSADIQISPTYEHLYAIAPIPGSHEVQIAAGANIYSGMCE